MLMNNLDPDVAENPDDLVVYGGIGRAARNWEAFDAIVKTVQELESDETLLVQSGKPVAVFKSHKDAPRVLIANSNIVPAYANWDTFHELDKKGLMMYGQMTAGSWIYIGSQGIVRHLRNICRNGKRVIWWHISRHNYSNSWSWWYGRCTTTCRNNECWGMDCD